MSSPEAPITLGIEMSNPSAASTDAQPSHAVALWDADRVILGSAPLSQTARGSDGVLSAIASLSASCNVEPSTIGRVLVSIGPGGYTALRIATTSAKILADTLVADLVAVPTPLVAAQQINPSDHPSLITLASKKDRTYATCMHSESDLRDMGVIDTSDLGALSIRTMYADQHLPESFAEFAAGNGITIVPITLDARNLLAAASGCDPIDPLHLSPNYAREPDAVTQWRARSSG